jgi:acyl-CoA synthetase (AMP-forming)/AMP-acid ligase II
MGPDTLFAALDAACDRWPDRPALPHAGRTSTYAELRESIGALARALRRLGVAPGDRVVCALPNGPEYIAAMGAAWACGAVHVGVDSQFTEAELARVVATTRARLLIADAHTLAELLGDDRGGRDGAGADVVALSPGDPAVIFISSGTTGVPKATLGYHGNLAQRWQRMSGWLGFRDDDVHLVQLPLAHGFGLMMAMAGLLGGGRLVLLDRFSTESALRAITEERVTVVNGAPAHFRMLLGGLDESRHDVRSLRRAVGTAAGFPAPLLRAIWDELGVEFTFVYGSSEGVGVATSEREDILLGSVGRPAPGAVRIVDASRRPLPVGEVGEICFSLRVYPVRYYDDERARRTAADPATDDEWYYSGDLGRLDETGRLYVHGRLKHQIDRGGMKVDPVEVEGVLLRTPGVADAAVIGVPDPVVGERVCACVVPAAGHHPTLDELRDALGRELAAYKLPQELRVVQDIPRTALGKVELRRLEALAAAPQGAAALGEAGVR